MWNGRPQGSKCLVSVRTGFGLDGSNMKAQALSTLGIYFSEDQSCKVLHEEVFCNQVNLGNTEFCIHLPIVLEIHNALHAIKSSEKSCSKNKQPF